MIELNLLPEELKKKKAKIKIELPELPLIPIAVGVVGALVAIQLLLNGLIFISGRQRVALEKKWKELNPQKEKLDGIKRQIFEIDKKNKAIEGLIEKRVNWALILNELSDNLSSNIWLTEISYDETTQRPRTKRRGRNKKTAETPAAYKLSTLKLSGSAVGKGEEATAHIARFIKTLKQDPEFFQYFEDVQLVSIKKSTVADQEVMNFTLACRFIPQEIKG